jgi:SNF2 family DNA or RNA helicase
MKRKYGDLQPCDNDSDVDREDKRQKLLFQLNRTASKYFTKKSKFILPQNDYIMPNNLIKQATGKFYPECSISHEQMFLDAENFLYAKLMNTESQKKEKTPIIKYIPKGGSKELYSWQLDTIPEMITKEQYPTHGVRGGIFADYMGSGKTIRLLQLIYSDRVNIPKYQGLLW